MTHDPDFRDLSELSPHAAGGGARPRGSVWKGLSRAMEFVIYALLVLAAVKLFGPELHHRQELIAEKERLDHVRDGKNAQVLRLRQEHRLLKTDKEYLETVARDRLDLQREGEHIVRIDRGDP